MGDPRAEVGGSHRVRSVTRRVSIGLLAGAGVAVAAAAVYGAVLPLRVAAALAVAAGAFGYLAMDRELVAERRAHNAERAGLARERTALVREHMAIVGSLLRARDGAGRDSGARERPSDRTAAESAAGAAAEAGSAGEPEGGLAEGGLAEIATVRARAAAWERFGESPAVVDLAAWEERLRRDVPARRGA